MIEHTHLASLVALLAQTIEARGFDRLAMLRQAGIDPAMLERADARLPCSQVDGLWRIVMEASGNDLGIALDNARRYDAGSMHVIGFGLQACDNLAQATERMARASAIFNSGLCASCAITGGEFQLTYDFAYPGAAPAKDMVTACITLHLWRKLLRPGLSPLSVQFAHLDQPADPVLHARVEEFFGCQVLYRQKRNCMTLACETALEPLRTANANLAARGELVVNAFLNELKRADIATAVVRHIADGDFNKESIARRLNMSTRTLQRRLVAEQISFAQLLTDTRRELACSHLLAGRYTIKEVAYKLGYSDAANFSRAFRAWYGVAPDAFRQGGQSQGMAPDNDSDCA